MDYSAVDMTVEVKRKLTKAGLIMGDNDTAIAGHAIASGCKLVTHNVREFSRVAGLDDEDWFTEENRHANKQVPS